MGYKAICPALERLDGRLTREANHQIGSYHSRVSGVMYFEFFSNWAGLDKCLGFKGFRLRAYVSILPIQERRASVCALRVRLSLKSITVAPASASSKAL